MHFSLVVKMTTDKFFLYRSKILNALFDYIYCVFCNTKTAFEL